MIEDVISIYKNYGFKCEKKYLSNKILVFTLNNGYFNNAEIVSIEDNDFVQEVFDSYSASGYACTTRTARSAQDVELALFKGFFFVDSTKERLRSDYQKFTKAITSFYSSTAQYKYINAPYTVNEKPGEANVTKEIVDKLKEDKPALFLIEAAAGFGKTCTAYEIVNEVLSSADKLPLFSELSRNRSAKIFRYVLLDEIDRTFPQLKSRLVEIEILNGRVVVILDGFDELLRKSDSGDDFEAAEPMLETIGELLQRRAKIILTTRRTILFEGDDFHRWADQNSDKFDVIRLRLSEPRINDWLPIERRQKLESAGFQIEGIANPVLLSYLRCITDEDFSLAIESKDELVSRYFNYMLERERTRQDLRLDVPGQYSVLSGIAKDMIDFGYTSESRDYVVDLIKTNFVKLLDDIRSNYASTEKPSRDEVANKLASHALLDKSASDDTKIGFINEFVFGNFVAENILKNSWWNDDLRFIEPAVLSYIPRSHDIKVKLKKSLDGVLEFLDWTNRIEFSTKLSGHIDFDLVSGEADSLSLDGISIGSNSVSQFQFNDCTFTSCDFIHKNISNATFLNCKFYDCHVERCDSPQGNVYVLGCIGDPDFIDGLSRNSLTEALAPEESESRNVEKYILEKFWPIGTPSFHRRRPIKGICGRSNEFSPDELYEGIDVLKKRGLLFEPAKPSFLEISIEHIGEIRNILGRAAV